MDKKSSQLARTQLALPISLLRTRELVAERFRPLLSSRGFTDPQWRVLRVLYESGHADAKTLANQACVLAPSLTRILRTLESEGLVRGGKDPDDRRRSVISITRKGRDILDASAEESAKIYHEIEMAIGSERLQNLLKELVEVRRALRKTSADD